MKPWIGVEIRLLRSQLGWSRVQLAKWLGCSPLKLVKMEEDELIPTQVEKVRLEDLSLRVEHCMDYLQRQAHAEAIMNEMGVDQIHVDEVDHEMSKKIEVDIKDPIE